MTFCRRALSIFTAFTFIFNSIGAITPLVVSAADPILFAFDLLTNGVENPIAIDNTVPQFSWKISGVSRNTMQTAYQILITEKISGAIIWDSGKKFSNTSSGVAYEGNSLKSDTTYKWKVKIWDYQNNTSDFSDEAMFRVGISKTDITADFIWDGSENKNDFAYFRKNFDIANPIKEAYVYVTAHNDYQLYLNGEKMGVGPARSNPYSYGQYYTYDVTTALQNGNNAFAALSHWHGEWSNSGVNAKPGFLLELRIKYMDNTTQTIKTDNTWKTLATTPYVEENPLYFGYHGGVKNRASINYDSRRETLNWNTKDFSDNTWENATIVKRSDFNLYAQLIGEEKEKSFEKPISVRKQDDKWFVEFKETLTGWPELKMHENIQDDIVKVQYWEVKEGWGDAGYDTYICKGGTETFYAPFVRHTSFKILEITGYKGNLTIDDVKGIVAYTDVVVKGEFESSDTRLNNVYKMSERSSRQNYQQGIISVDANREQSPWTADSWNIGVGFLYNYENSLALDKIIKDYAAEQLPSGNFLSCSPAKDYKSELAEWSLYWPMLLWEQYLFNGNKKLLNDYYQNLTNFLNFIKTSKNHGTGLYNPAGWRASDYAGGSLENGGENIATNCHIYQNYIISAKIAKILGKDSDGENYKVMAEKLKYDINRNLLKDGTSYKSTPTSTQTHPLAAAWALRFDIVPPALREKIIIQLARQKDEYDVGGYGGDALYNGLYNANLGAIATNDFARYDNMINTNNTNWESFGELGSENMGNHAWTAYPAYILPKYVGGISPTTGGFETFDIKPVIGGLTYAKTKISTVKGEVKSDWKKVSSTQFLMSVKIPGNTTAKIYIPDNDMSNLTVKENDQTVFKDDIYNAEVTGITDAKKVENYIVLTVGSGDYNFSVTGTANNTPEIGTVEDVYVLDENQAILEGNWTVNRDGEANKRYGSSFHYSSGVAEANASATFSQKVAKAGKYNVFGWWPTHENRATDTPFTVTCDTQMETVRVNQEQNGATWNQLTSINAKAGDTITVKITNDADEYVIADAVKIALDGIDEEVVITEHENLQMLLYGIYLPEIENCKNKTMIDEFYQAVSFAETICGQKIPTVESCTTAINRIKGAIKNVKENLYNNFALNKIVIASEELTYKNQWNKNFLTDGYKSRDSIEKIGYTSNTYTRKDLTKPIDITINLDNAKYVNQIILYPRIDANAWNGKTANFPENYEVQVIENGSSYKTVKTVVGQVDPDFGRVVLNFPRNFAKYVRLHITKFGEYLISEPINSYRLQLSEIEIFDDVKYIQKTESPIIPISKTFIDKAKITIKCPLDTIFYYTTDGKTPTIKSAKLTGTKDFLFTKNTIFKILAIKSGYTSSNIVTKNYTIKTTLPIIPISKTFIDKAKITIRSPLGTIFYYTTNGKTPTIRSAKLTGTKNFLFTKNTIFKIAAIKLGCTSSSTVTKNYTIKTKMPSNNYIPKEISFKKNKKITIKAPKNYTIYYSRDGKKYTKILQNKKKKLNLTKTTKLKIYAVKAGCVKSVVITRKYKKKK